MALGSLPLALGGPSVSRLVLGLWRLPEWGMDSSKLLSFLEECLDLGVTTLDHADIYGDYTCEQRFGDALALRPELREHLQIITKCGIRLISENRPAHRIKHYDTSREHILASVDHSLQALRTDYLDVLLLHRPDPLMNADEVAEAFATLRQGGKVRYFGVSNFTPAQFELLDSRVEGGLVTNQLEISVLHREPFFDGSLDLYQQRRIAPMAWSPLGGGRLFGGTDPQAQRLRSAMSVVAAELGGAGLDQLALAWLLTHPSRIVPVLGTGKIERVKAAVDAVDLRLSKQQWFAVLEASAGVEVP